MSLTVIHQTLRNGRVPGGLQFQADYTLATDGSLLAGDVVVWAHQEDGTGPGDFFWAEWDNGGGRIPSAISPFSPNGGLGFDVATGVLKANALGAMNYQLILSTYLVDLAANPLLRFGFARSNVAIDTDSSAPFAIWVIRNITVNSIPAGSSVFPGLPPPTFTPAPGQGVLTAHQMLFGLGFSEKQTPGSVGMTLTQNLAGFHEVTLADLWFGSVGNVSSAYCTIWGGPGQDATGQAFTAAGDVYVNASALLGLLDLTSIDAPGFGYGNDPFGP
jgi:hypothetical protein